MRWAVALATAASLTVGAAAADPLPNCMDIVEGRQQPGALPDCAPAVVSNELAFDFLHKELPFREVRGRYFLALPLSEWKTFDLNEMWWALSMAVSSALALYGEADEVYFVVEPEREIERQALAHGVVRGHVVARARHAWHRDDDVQAPPDALPKRYTLIVYGPPVDPSQSSLRGQ